MCIISDTSGRLSRTTDIPVARWIPPSHKESKAHGGIQIHSSEEQLILGHSTRDSPVLYSNIMILLQTVTVDENLDSTEFIVTLEREREAIGYTNTLLVLGIGKHYL